MAKTARPSIKIGLIEPEFIRRRFLDSFQQSFWDRLRSSFPELRSVVSADEDDFLRIKALSPFRLGGEELEIIVYPDRLNCEVVVAFGGGHMHCGHRESCGTDAVIDVALDAVGQIVTEMLVGVRFSGGGGMLCPVSELSNRTSANDRIESWRGSFDHGRTSGENA